ncbi:MAG: nuclear transport factor 2 family protein [Miltoncostaeaceae bacterium]
MADKHPNISLLERLDLADLAGAADIFAEDVVFHYFNPSLPELQGDYIGLDGLKDFFGRIASLSAGTFVVEPISIEAVGDELVVTHTRNSLEIMARPIRIDVVVVWRVVEGRIAEVWDIPSAHVQSDLSQDAVSAEAR